LNNHQLKFTGKPHPGPGFASGRAWGVRLQATFQTQIHRETVPGFRFG
jgi:hypothetical protein